jgi:hypothetical protein
MLDGNFTIRALASYSDEARAQPERATPVRK